MSYSKYTHRYCKKAKCIFCENESHPACKKGLYPTNNNKVKRLHQATGYCDEYQSPYEEKFRNIAFTMLSTQKDKFTRKLQKEIENTKKKNSPLPTLINLN